MSILHSNSNKTTPDLGYEIEASEWNQGHVLNLTLTGNTAGQSTYAGSNLLFAGGPNVTLSLVGDTLSFSGGAGAAGNTGYVSAGTTNASLGTLSLANSNGISWGINGQTLTATVKTDYLTTAALSNHSHGNPQLNLTNLSGTTASNSAGFTLSLSAGNYLTTAAVSDHSHGNPTLALTNLSGTTASNSAGLTLSLSAAAPGGAGFSAGNSNLGNTAGDTGVVTGRLVMVGTNNITLSGSTNGGSMTISISGGAGAAGNTGYISGGTTNASLGTLSIANSNGISFGIDGQTLTATVKTDYLTSQSNQALSGSNGSFAFQTATFGNLNGLSFYTSNGSLVGSHNALTTARASNDAVGLNTALTAGPLAWTVNSGGISLNAGSAAGTTSGFGGNLISGSMTHNTAGLNLSLNHPAWLTTAMQSNAATISNIRVSAGTTSNLLSAMTFGNANGITFGLNASTLTASHNGLTTAAASDHSHGNPTLALTNLSGTTASNSAGLTLSLSAGAPGGGGGTFGMSNIGNTAGTSGTVQSQMLVVGGPNITVSQSINGQSATLSISGNAPGAAAENNWMSLLGANVSGNSTASGSTVGLSGINLTLSGTNNSVINISAPATSSLVGVSGVSISTNGSTISVMNAGESYLAWPYQVVDHATQTQTVGSNTSIVFPIQIKEVEHISFFRNLGTVSMASQGSVATSANNTRSYTQQATFNYVMYSRGVGASSQSLQSVGSTSVSSQMTIQQQAGANGSQWSVTHGFTFPCSSGYVNTSTSYATTLTNVNISTTHLTFMTGIKFLEVPWTTTFEPNQYWMASGFDTAQTTAGNQSLSAMRVTSSNYGMSQPNLTVAPFGSANNATVQLLFGLGSYSKAAVGTTGSIGFSNISSSASHVIPTLTFVRIA